MENVTCLLCPTDSKEPPLEWQGQPPVIGARICVGEQSWRVTEYVYEWPNQGPVATLKIVLVPISPKENASDLR